MFIWFMISLLFRILVVFPLVSFFWQPNIFFSIFAVVLPTIVFSLSPSTLRDPIYDKLSCIPLGSYFSGSRITCLLSILSFLLLSAIDSHHRLSSDWSFSSLPKEARSYWRFTRNPFMSLIFTILMCRMGSVRKVPTWLMMTRREIEVDPVVALVGVFCIFGLWLLLVGNAEGEVERERVKKEWEERQQRQKEESSNRSKSSHSDFAPDPTSSRLSDDSKSHPGATGEVLRVLKCRSHYEVLGLSREEVDAAHKAGTLADVIKKAMRVKSLSVHPDKVGAGAVGAKEAFQRVNEAASLLSNAQQRAALDSHDEENKSRHSAGSSSSSSSSSTPNSVGEELVFPCAKVNQLSGTS